MIPWTPCHVEVSSFFVLGSFFSCRSLFAVSSLFPCRLFTGTPTFCIMGLIGPLGTEGTLITLAHNVSRAIRPRSVPPGLFGLWPQCSNVLQIPLQQQQSASRRSFASISLGGSAVPPSHRSGRIFNVVFVRSPCSLACSLSNVPPWLDPFHDALVPRGPAADAAGQRILPF